MMEGTSNLGQLTSWPWPAEPQPAASASGASPLIYLKVEKNSKGFNWEISVTGADSLVQALVLLDAGVAELSARYGNPVTDVKEKGQ